jgi:WD40 repeat protein
LSHISAEIARLHAQLPQDDPNHPIHKWLEELSNATNADRSDDEGDDELHSGIHIVTTQGDIQPNYDLMVESASRLESSTQSDISKRTQDGLSHGREPKLEPHSTPPESRKTSFNANPSTLFPPSSIYRRHSISSDSPGVPLLEWDPSVRRTSLASTILARKSIDQANLSAGSIPTETKKKTSFFRKIKDKLSEKKTLTEWPESKPLRTIQGHTDRVYAVAFSPDGTLMATGSKDMKVRLWDPATGVVHHTLEGHTGSVYTVSFSPDGQFAASASWDGPILIWDLATGESKVLKGHKSSVSAVAFSPDGQLVASASWDKTIRLWELATGKPTIFKGHTGRVSDVAFSPDGKLVASASWDKTIRLWELATGKSSILEGHTSWVGAVSFSPDGQLVASASGDMTVRLWDPATGELLRTLQGHRFLVRAVAFSPDSQVVASASADHTVRLWDSATGTAHRLLRGHEGEVYGVAFSPNGQLIASASADKTVRFWEPLPLSRHLSQS